MSGNRQERRRREREAGYRRTEAKRGRRPRMREGFDRQEEDDTYEALEQAGFLLARITPKGRIR